MRERCSFDCPASHVPPTDVVTSAISDPGQEVLHPDEDETTTTDEKKPDWKPPACATAKLFLRGVRDAADAFGPLKSVAGGLCIVLDNCEVWSPTGAYHLRRLRVFQPTKVNQQAIELLVPRVRALDTYLCVPAPEGDSEEQGRRKRLER